MNSLMANSTKAGLALWRLKIYVEKKGLKLKILKERQKLIN